MILFKIKKNFANIFITNFAGQPKARWKFVLPTLTIKNKSKIFCNALLAFVFAYYYSLFIDEEDFATFSAFQQWTTRSLQSEVETFILCQIKPFLRVLSNYNLGCEEWFSLLSEQTIAYCDYSGNYKLNVQFYIFHKSTGTFVSSFPPQYDESRRHIFLLGDYEDNLLTNLELITNLTTFFRYYGIYCFFCQKMFKGQGTQHKCSLTKCCFVCKRPFLSLTTYTNKFTEKLFCNSSLSASEASYCEKCNLRTFSNSCQVHHKQKVCRFGWYCKNCNQYTSCSKFLPNVKNIRENHICYKRVCYFCGIVLDAEHQCPLRAPEKPNFFTKVGFIDIQITGISKLNCYNCFF